MSSLFVKNDAETSCLVSPSENQTSSSQKSSCGNCGYFLPHRFSTCPAKNKRCVKCNKQGHFGKVCRSSAGRNMPRKPASYQSSTYAASSTLYAEPAENREAVATNEDLFSVKTQDSPERQHFVTLKVIDKNISWLVDTGSTVNLMNVRQYRELNPIPDLIPTAVKIYTYGSVQPLLTLGVFQTKLSFQDNHETVSIIVIDSERTVLTPLLGLPSSVALGIVAFNGSNNLESDLEFERNILCTYKDLFQGVGKLSNFRVKLHVDDKIKPIAQAPRRVPLHLRKKLEEELDVMIENDIIEKVNGPTPWVSPIVLVPKSNDSSKIRVCTDMRLPNQAILRERHVMPTLDEIISRLNGAKFFTKLDLNSGYHQLELEPESRPITVFTTHKGLFQYKRLNFGINAASEIFQNAIEQVIQDIPQACNSSDDILVFGNTSDEHDKTLLEVLQRIRSRNLTLNRKKCEFKKNKLIFYGMVFGDKGVSPDPQKIIAIKKAVAPQNVSEMRSFLGLVTYCSRFIPNLASIAEPLRNLTKKDTKWEWGPSQRSAWELIKYTLVDSTCLNYFNPENKTELIVDASPVGLGAILTQADALGNSTVIAFGSRALNSVEQRYSQTEREALAIVWGCELLPLWMIFYSHI